MPKPSTRSGQPGRIGRRLGSLAAMALLPLLVIQMGVLWLVLDGAEVTLPDSLGDRLREHLSRSGLACEWKRATVSLSGRIELTDAKVGGADGSDPVFEAGRLVTILDMFDLVLRGKVTPRRLWLDRGRLTCPAIVSPTGRAETALSDVRASFSREGDRLIVETLQAHCAGIPLTASGELLPPRRKLPMRGAPGPQTTPMRAPALAAARLVALRPWLDRLEGASLALSGKEDGDGIRLSLDGLASAIRMPHAEVEKVRLHAAARWSDDGLHPEGPAEFSVFRLRLDAPAAGTVPPISATCDHVVLRATPGWDWTAPTGAHITARRPVVNGFALDRLDLRLDAGAHPSVKVEADALWRRERATARIESHVGTGETRIDFEARVRPSELEQHPSFPANLPREATALRVVDFVDLSGCVRLGEKHVFRRLDLRLASGHTRYFAIDVPSFRAALEVTPDRLRAYDLEILSPAQSVRGSFETGFKADSPYRLLLVGEAYPEQVEPFVGKWWKVIWKDLAVTPGHPAHADIEVNGHWSGPPYEFIFASIHARKLSYRKQVFERAALNLLELPDRLAVHDIALANPDGTHAGGRLEWAYRMPDHKLDSVRFLFQGRLPLRVAAELGGDDVVQALADVSLTNPADATVIGRYHGPASPTPSRDQLEVRVASKGPFEAWKLPGEDFSGTVLLDNRRIQIKDARLRYAGGDASGTAWIHRVPSGYRLTFDAAVAKCDRGAFFEGLGRLKSDDSTTSAPPQKPPEKAPEKSRPADLSGTLRARIALPDLGSLDGAGTITTNDPAMLRLPLFGVLSKGLARLGVNLGNYTFDRADGEFLLREGSVWFPRLAVQGPEAVVNLRGSYGIATDALDFQAVLNPKSPDKIPILDSVRALAGRTTRLFPVDIKGTLAKPEWTLEPTLSPLFSEQREDSLGLPPPSQPDDGQW